MTTGFPSAPGGVARPRSPWRVRVALLLVLVIAGGSGVAWWGSGRTESGGVMSVPPAVSRDDSTARAPADQRVRVRVVNVSGVNGLARRATQYLRDFGYDVVDFGSSATESKSTRIVVHTGHDDWGTRLQRALGVGAISADADSSRYVDLTVFIGSDWRAPAESLGP